MSLSLNHSYYQSSANATLRNLKKYSIFTELSLLIDTKEYVPDICVYAHMKINRSKDILRMTEMPLLAIEIISHTQGSKEILDKFEIYFAARIKSCWLIDPATSVVTVYASLDKFRTFVENDIIDTALDLKIPIKDIFDDE